MKMHVYFLFEGIPGRETFETSVDYRRWPIAAYTDVQTQFWKKAHEVGAITRTSGGNAWCQVDTLDGPTVVHYEVDFMPVYQKEIERVLFG